MAILLRRGLFTPDQLAFIKISVGMHSDKVSPRFQAADIVKPFGFKLHFFYNLSADIRNNQAVGI